MGEVVRVKDGYARNFLLPRGKALRATEANKKHFDGQRAQLETRNLERKGEAAGRRRKAERPDFHHHAPGRRIRPALWFGLDPRHRRGGDRRRFHRSSATRSCCNTPIKALGLHKAPVHLHPEVDVEIIVNIARSAEEAERQAKGESAVVREETTMADLGLEIGAALAEAGDVEM